MGIEVVLFVLSTAIGSYQQQQARKKAAAARDASLGQDVRVSNSAQQIPVLYGRCAYQGTSVWAGVKDTFPTATTISANLLPSSSRLGFSTSGKRNEYLMQQVVIGTGEINKVSEVWVNDTDPTTGDLAGSVFCEWRNGGTAAPVATAFSTELTTAAKFSEHVFATMCYKLDRESPQFSGLPQPIFFVEGRKVHSVVRSGAGTESDPYTYALSTNETYSANVARVLLDYMCNDNYGPGWSVSDDIDLEAFYTAQQLCDNTVLGASPDIEDDTYPYPSDFPDEDDLPDDWPADPTYADVMALSQFGLGTFTGDSFTGNSGYFANRWYSTDTVANAVNTGAYEFHGAIPTDGDHRSNIANIINVIPGAELFRSPTGKWKFVVPDSRTAEATQSVGTIDESDLTSDVEIIYPDSSDKLNQLSVRFTNFALDYANDTLTFPEEGSTFHTELVNDDNSIDLRDSVDIDGIGNIYQAQSWASRTIAISRRESYKFKTRPVGFLYEPGDIVKLKDDLAGVDQYVKIVQTKVLRNLDVEFTAIHFDKDDYAWRLHSIESINNRAAITDDPGVPANVAATWSATERVVDITWDANDNEDVTVNGYIVEYAEQTADADLDSALTWITLTKTIGEEAVHRPGDSEKEYRYRVRSETSDARRSAPTAGTSAVEVSATEAAAVTNLKFRRTSVIVDNDDAFVNGNVVLELFVGSASKGDINTTADSDDDLSDGQWYVTSTSISTTDSVADFTAGDPTFDATNDTVTYALSGYKNDGTFTVNVTYQANGGTQIDLTTEIDIVKATPGADGAQGATGPAGMPGISTEIIFDDRSSDSTPDADGEYYVLNGSNEATTWANFKSADSLRLAHSDKDGIAYADFLRGLLVGDFIIFYVSSTQWINWRITSKTNRTHRTDYGITMESVDETGGTTLPSSTSDVSFRFSAARPGSNGLPAASKILIYDDFETDNSYSSSQWGMRNADDDNNISSWDDMKSGGILKLNSSDINGSQSDYLGIVSANDVVTLFVQSDRWIAYNITSASKTGSVYSFAVDTLYYEEAGGSTNLSTADGNNVEFRFSRGIEGSDGADGVDGADGADGNTNAQLSIFRRSATAPTTPTGGSYNFSTNTITAPTDWSATPPTGTDALWVSSGIASIVGVSGTDSSITWSSPAGYAGTDGADGTAGKSTYQAVIFRRASAAPSTPTGGSFNFGTNTLTAPTNWSESDPGGSETLYSSRALFSISGDSGTDSSPTWSSPAEYGPDGADGLSTYLISAFRRSASTPTTPTGGSYNFGTETFTAPTDWSGSVPSGTDPLYVTTALASVQGTTGSDTTLTWQTPRQIARDGVPGIPAAAKVLDYDHLLTSNPAESGGYAFRNADDDGYASTWDDIKQASKVALEKRVTDATDESDYFDLAVAGDIFVYYIDSGKWIEYELTSDVSLTGDVYTFTVDLVEYRETTDTDDPSGDDGTAVTFRFNRQLTGAAGRNGLPGVSVTVDLSDWDTTPDSTGEYYLSDSSDAAYTFNGILSEFQDAAYLRYYNNSEPEGAGSLTDAEKEWNYLNTIESDTEVTLYVSTGSWITYTITHAVTESDGVWRFRIDEIDSDFTDGSSFTDSDATLRFTQGRAGDPGPTGLPATSTILYYDDFQTSGVPTAAGEYSLYRVGSSSYTGAWSSLELDDIRFEVYESDKDSVDHSRQWDSLKVNDTFTLYEGPELWAQRIVTSVSKTGSYYVIGTDHVASNLKDAPSGNNLNTPDNERQFRFGNSPDGRPGLPGAAKIATYDNLETGTIDATGEYSFRNADDDGDATSWADLKEASKIRLYETDTDSNNLLTYFQTLQINDVITYFIDTGKWIEYRITASPTVASPISTFDVSVVEYDETSDTDDPSTDDGTSIQFRFNRAETGPDGRPGLPGAGGIFTYDDLEGASPDAAGEYAFRNDDDDAYATTWTDIKAASKILLRDTDGGSTDQSDYLDSIEIGDVIVYYISAGQWVDYEVTEAPSKSSNVYTFTVDTIEFDETDSTSDPSGTDGTDVQFRFSRGVAGTDGVDGTDGRPGIPGAAQVYTYDHLQSTSTNVNFDAEYAFRNSDNTATATTWADIKQASRIVLDDEDLFSNDNSSYLQGLEVGDIVIYYISVGKWVQWRLNADPIDGDGITTLPVNPVTFDETDGTDDPSQSNGTQVEFRFGRQLRGPDGRPGLPGAARIFNYDNLVTSTPIAFGQYGFRNSADNGYTSTWGGIKEASKIHLFDEDAADNDQTDYLNQIDVGDVIVYYISSGQWIDFEVTAKSKSSGVYIWTVDTIEHDETDSTDDPSTDDGTDVYFRFSRAVDGDTGATGARGAGRWHIDVDNVSYVATDETDGELPTTVAGAQEAWDEGSFIGGSPGDAVDGDQAWFFTGTIQNPTAQSVWIYQSSGTNWIEQTEVIDGDLLVNGTITASALAADSVTAVKINVNNLAAINASLGDITAGTLKGGTIPDADDAPSGTEAGSFFDLSGGKFIVGDADAYLHWDGTNLNQEGLQYYSDSITIYQAASTAPSSPADTTVTYANDGTYTFTPPTGWSAEVPESTNAVYSVNAETQRKGAGDATADWGAVATYKEASADADYTLTLSSGGVTRSFIYTDDADTTPTPTSTTFSLSATDGSTTHTGSFTVTPPTDENVDDLVSGDLTITAGSGTDQSMFSSAITSFSEAIQIGTLVRATWIIRFTYTNGSETATLSVTVYASYTDTTDGGDLP